jgi:hypothetical protein
MVRPCSFLLPSEGEGFEQNEESLAQPIQIQLERRFDSMR